MAYESAGGQRFPYTYDQVFTGLLRVIPQEGFTIRSHDKDIGRIECAAGWSMSSFGENISISVEDIDGSSARVNIQSGLKFQGNRNAIFTGEGRNAKNVRAIISALTEYLKTQAKPVTAKQCPNCAETVKAEAKVCRFCGYDLQTKQPVEFPSSQNQQSKTSFESADKLQKKQHDAREILADVIVELEQLQNLMATLSKDKPDVDLTRKLAFIQAKQQFLEGVKSCFTTLSELTELRRVNNQLSEVVRTYAENGVCSMSPLVDAQTEIIKLRAFVTQAQSFYHSCCVFGLFLLDTKTFPISSKRLNDCQQEFQELCTTVKPRLEELETMVRTVPVLEGEEGAQQLIFLGAVEGIIDGNDATNVGDSQKTELVSTQWFEWCLLPKGEGRYYAELNTHLETIRVRIDELQLHAVDNLGRTAQALASVRQGNYVTAKRILAECNKFVVSTNHDECIKEIHNIEERILECERAPKINSLRSTLLSPLPLDPFKIKQEMNACRAVLSEARAWIDSEQKKLAETNPSG